MKHVLIVTSTNLACNPRCLKEVRLLASMDVKLTVVAFNLHNWTTDKESELINELKDVRFHHLESTRKDFFPWLTASLFEKACKIFFTFNCISLFISAMCVSKRSWLILKWAKKNKQKFDLIIAHNPAAFYPVYYMAKKGNANFALDIEDYHPGEGTDKHIQKAVACLMKKITTQSLYCSFASPLIKEFFIQREGLRNDDEKFFVINNVFAQSDFIEVKKEEMAERKIKSVWFSQYIDYGRGLEKLLPVLDQFEIFFELILIGNIRPEFFANEIAHRNYIQCIPALSQTELHLKLCSYDVGFALEDAAADVNRNICLTNKIWSYFQAGLFIIASDTQAQKLFVEQFPVHGICTSLTGETLSEALLYLMKNRESIFQHHAVRYNLAKNFSWDNEALKLIRKWNQIVC